jgi:8-oxo-dGDP phosphatase
VTDGAERTRWKVLADRVVGEKPRIRLSVASVELPDGTVFDQCVMRTARCALLAAAGVSRLRSRPPG